MAMAHGRRIYVGQRPAGDGAAGQLAGESSHAAPSTRSGDPAAAKAALDHSPSPDLDASLLQHLVRFGFPVFIPDELSDSVTVRAILLVAEVPSPSRRSVFSFMAIPESLGQ